MTKCRGIDYLQTGIDSLKIRIPLYQVKLLIDPRKDEYGITNLSTGHIVTEIDYQERNTYYVSPNRKVKIYFENIKTSRDKHTECIVILLNSKFTGSHYFESIHLDLIPDIYSDLMSLGVFHIDYEDFLKAECTDIDLKHDQRMSLPEYIELIDIIKHGAKQSKVKNKGYRLFYQTTENQYNMGLEFSGRTVSSISSPFVKVYWKGGELLSNSFDFYDEYLTELQTEEQLLQVRRIEVTIKNKKHGQALGIESTSFLSLLMLSQEKMQGIISKCLSKHIDIGKPKPKGQSKGLKPDQIIHLNAMRSIYREVRDFEEVLSILTAFIPSPQTRSRKKTELTNLYNEHLKDLQETTLEDKLTFLRLKRA